MKKLLILTFATLLALPGMVFAQRSTSQPATAAASFQLTVSVNPPTAAIFIDGAQIKGNVATVTPGNHTILTKAPGYTDFQTTVNVTGNLVLPITMAAIVVIQAPPPVSLGLVVAVFEKGIGRVEGTDRVFVGTKGQTRPLQDFSVAFRTRNSTLSLRYTAHISNVGDVGPVQEGTMFGYANRQNIEGFSIELTGPDANLYNIFYSAHIQNAGDTQTYKNGAYCGTRGQSLAIEGITVWVEKK